MCNFTGMQSIRYLRAKRITVRTPTDGEVVFRARVPVDDLIPPQLVPRRPFTAYQWLPRRHGDPTTLGCAPTL